MRITKRPFELFHIECGKGWESLYKPILEYIENYNTDKKEEEKIIVTQVKEKWGGLRFYVSHHTDELFEMINNAEKESYEICETCGTRDNVGLKGGWYETICYNCVKKRSKESCMPIQWINRTNKEKYWIYPDYDEKIEEKAIENESDF